MTEAEKTIPYGNLTCNIKTEDGRYFRVLCGRTEHDEISSSEDELMTYFDKSQGPVADLYYGDPVSESAEKLYRDYDITRVDPENSKTIIYYSTVYRPVTYDGKTVAVMSLETAWTYNDLMDILSMTKDVEIRNALCMTVSMTLLLIILYLLAVKPISFLQMRVRDYTKDKDAKKTAEKLSKIRSKNEIGRLSDDVSHLALEMEEYSDKLIRMTAEEKRISTELELATQIQMSILPKNFPAFPDRDDFDIFASMTPAKEVGGDLYDFILADEDHLGVVIGDVSGKGVPASIFMAITKALIRNEMMRGLMDPAEILINSNKQLCEGNDRMMFVTIFVGILELSSGRLIYANGGHNYPMIKSKDEGFKVLYGDNDMPLGLMDDYTYSTKEYMMGPGSVLYLYTDGFMEAMNKEGEQFGEDRMLMVLNEEPDLSPRELDGKMRQRVSEFVKDAEQFDDMTMLCVKLHKSRGNADRN